MESNNEVKNSNFIKDIIEKDLSDTSKVVTRFPPEPNGYLHLGHAKSICLNFGLAKEYGGKCNLRFDDTNPAKEDMEFVNSIKNDIKWLGFDWEDRLFFASSYFDKMYECAIELIKKGNKTLVERRELLLNEKNQLEKQIEDHQTALERLNMKIKKYDELIKQNKK